MNEAPETEATIDTVEPSLKRLQKTLRSLKRLEKTLRRLIPRFLALNNAYPQITSPDSGGPGNVPRLVNLTVNVSSNVMAAGLYEIAVVTEGSTVPVAGCVAAVIPNAATTGTATLTAAMLGNLAANSDYLLICQKVPGCVQPTTVVTQQIAIHTDTVL